MAIAYDVNEAQNHTSTPNSVLNLETLVSSKNAVGCVQFLNPSSPSTEANLRALYGFLLKGVWEQNRIKTLSNTWGSYIFVIKIVILMELKQWSRWLAHNRREGIHLLEEQYKVTD